MKLTHALAGSAFLTFATPVLAAGDAGTVTIIPDVPVQHPAASGSHDRSVRVLPADLKRQLDFLPQLDHAKNTIPAPPAPLAFVAPPVAPPTAPSTASVVSSWTGISDANWAPSDTNAGYGPNTVIQAVNSHVTAYSRTGGVQSLNEDLCTFLNVATSDCFDPRIKWDDGTQHFYATGLAVFGSTNVSIAYMYSTSLNPGHSNWCRYNISYSLFPDYDTLGDGSGVIGIAFDAFQSTAASAPWLGSHFLRLNKAALGQTTCMTVAQLGVAENTDLRDANGNKVFQPFPADIIDSFQPGYILARSGSLPSSNLWQFKYDKTTMPGTGQAVALGITDDDPPPATQVGDTRTIDTGQGGLWGLQAAVDPNRGGLMLWFALTVPAAQGIQADTVVFEVDPATRSWVYRQRLHTDGLSTYAATMSSNRQCANSGTCSGGSGWVVAATQSGSPAGLNPRAVVFGSSSPTTARVARAAGGPYRDFTCPNSSDICRMDYSSAEPDPNSGNVGISATYSGGGTSTSQANWRTVDGYVTP